MSLGLVAHVLSRLHRSRCFSLMPPSKYRSKFPVRSCLSGFISMEDQVWSSPVPGSRYFISDATCSHLPIWTSQQVLAVKQLPAAFRSYLCPRPYCVHFSCCKGTDDHDDDKKINSQPRDNNIVNIKTSEFQKHEAYMSSVRRFTFWVCATVTFGIGVGFKEGVNKASEFFAGYILEQLLSVDNLCVFLLIFKYFKVPKKHQNHVLSYGIGGAIIFRLVFILLGSATLQNFEVVNLGLAAILLYSSFKLFDSSDDDEEDNNKSDLSDNLAVKTCKRFIPVTTTYYDGNRFMTNQDGVWKATPLFVTVAVIELSDIAFAVDSISAIFGVTRDPFIIFSSNLFAIMSLRSLYSIISKGMSDLKYLQPSIAVVLGFFGGKMILDYFGIIHVSTVTSLGFVASSLSIGILLSLAKKSKNKLK